MRVVNRRITWCPGGIRRTTDTHPSWEGWTGFVSNARTIEEPNPFTKIIKNYLSHGWVCWVADFGFSFDSHREVYEAVLEAYEKEKQKEDFYKSLDIEVHVPAAVTIYFSPEEGPHNFHNNHWVVLRPQGRMTPYESWIVDSRIDTPTLSFADVTPADD